MIFLICGFMGSGKTTFLSKLKSHCGEDCLLFDLDQEIFNKYGTESQRDLGVLIDQVGWDQFRSWESEVLKELLTNLSAKSEHSFISLGGGTLNEHLCQLINEDEAIELIWIKTPVEVCLNRISQSDERPLAKKSSKYLKDLYQEREKFYQNARICLTAAEQDMVWDAQKLIEAIER